MAQRLSRGAELVGHFSPADPRWHDLRNTGIGGSEIAAIMGLSPWDSAFSLWHRKRGHVEPKPSTAEMSWGHRHEDTIARWYRDVNPGVRVARTGTWRNLERPYQLANPDRLLSGRKILEVKTDRSGDGWGAQHTDEIPVYYRAQALWYLDVLGWDTADIAVLIGLSDARIYTVRWNADEVGVIRKAAEDFWQSVQTGVQPPLDGHDATYRVMREVHPGLDDLAVEIPEELATRYRAACAGERVAVRHKQEAVVRMLDAMGTARRATCNGESIAIRVPGKNGGPPSLRPSPVKHMPRKIGDQAA